jgi:hypothetical protein
VQEQRLSREDPAGGHDRIWFNYQPGYEANQEIHGTGHTTYDTMMELHTKNDYLIQEQQGYKKCLQRRYAKTPDTELQSMRWWDPIHFASFFIQITSLNFDGFL